MFYLEYSMSGVYVNIHLSEKSITDKKHGFIIVDLATRNSVVNAIKKGLTVKVVDSEVKYGINFDNKRIDIVKERDSYSEKVLPFLDTWYQEKHELTLEQIDDVKELYYRLCDAPQHYDVSDDKESWSMKFVEEYTSGKNTNNYQLKKLNFVKW